MAKKEGITAKEGKKEGNNMMVDSSEANDLLAANRNPLTLGNSRREREVKALLPPSIGIYTSLRYDSLAPETGRGWE